jgi:hypothetical protein
VVHGVVFRNYYVRRLLSRPPISIKDMAQQRFEETVGTYRVTRAQLSRLRDDGILM